MIIYSKTGRRWSNDYEFNIVAALDQVDFTSNNVTYYHHPYDNLFHGINFIEAVDLIHFEHIKNNPTVTLVHENSSEAIDARFAEEVFCVISTHKINPQQIKIIAADENHKNFLRTYLENKGITGVQIAVNNHLLSKVNEIPDSVEEQIITTNKFSSLSRNYKDWRLFLYQALFTNDLLKHFKYSFHNIWPYSNENITFSIDQMTDDLKKLGVSSFSNGFMKWLNRCPHDIVGLELENNVKNKWSNVTYDAILSADFHLMIETHFDQRAFTGQLTFNRSHGPSSITEKAYKAIACARPFITFATPYFLEDIQNLGYKTFSPFINEDYDIELDNTKRLNMIVAEVSRICNLPDSEYSELVKNCRNIAKFNKQHFENQKKNFKYDD